MRIRSQLLLAATCLTLAHPALAANPNAPSPAQIAEAKALLGKSVAFNTAQGARNTVAYANFLGEQFKAAGFAAEDITITPVDDTANLTLRYRGKGGKRPMVVTGHMDVVAANPKDWTRDPFTMVEENGYLFGRGVEDNKFDVSMVAATLMRLKREGFMPDRDIYLMLSGDEETQGNTAPLQAKVAKAANAEFMLNTDGGGGELGEDGKPIGYGVQGAEKAYADFEVTFTNPGGHSSAPRPDNAINNAARAALAVAGYQFPVMSNAWTLGSFAAAGKTTPAPMGPAMLAFAANPNDAAAAAIIAADPMTVGQLRTTCVSTMVSGGHAPNALPQRAALTINCRIFPGTPVEDVRKKIAELVNTSRAAGAPEAEVKAVGGWVAGDASPLRPDIMNAVTAAVQARYPGIAVVPSMSSGATDSVFYRALGIPSYGTAALFMKSSDSYAHGLNERVPVAAIPGALQQWHQVITTLAK